VTIAASAVTFRTQLEAIPDEIRGLWATPKTLPPKLFYDARGAELFERAFIGCCAAERGARPSTVLGPGFDARSAIFQISEQL